MNIGRASCHIICGIVVVSSCACQSTSTAVDAKLGFRYLQARFTGAVTEYEFCPGGRLIEYNYVEECSESGPDVPAELFEPRFSVSSLKWQVTEKQLTIWHGNKEERFEITQDAKHVYFRELTWDKVTKLSFFDRLHNYRDEQYAPGQLSPGVKLRCDE